MVEHHPWQEEILKIICEKKYGKIKRIISYNNFILNGENDFRMVSKYGGGAIYDLGCYCLQFVQRMIGLEFNTISCQTNSYGPNKIDTEFHASLSTDDAIKVELYGSFIKPFKARHTVECEKGTIEVKNFFRAGFGYNNMYLHCTDSISGKSDVVSFEPMNYYYNQLIDLIDAIETGKFINQLMESGLRVKIMEKLHEVRKINDHQPSGTS
jgi:predicted dehydrogenase